MMRNEKVRLVSVALKSGQAGLTRVFKRGDADMTDEERAEVKALITEAMADALRQVLMEVMPRVKLAADATGSLRVTILAEADSDPK